MRSVNGHEVGLVVGFEVSHGVSLDGLKVTTQSSQG